MVGTGVLSSVAWSVHRGSNDDLPLLEISSGGVWQIRDLQLSRSMLYLLSPRLCFFIILKRDLFVYRVIHYCPCLCDSLLAVLGVRVSMTFHLMCVHINFSSVWVAK